MKRIATRKYLYGLGTLAIGLTWVVAPLAASSYRIYVTNHAGTTISVVDPATNKVVNEIKDIEAPESVQFSPDGARVYITQAAESFVIVLDRKTGKEIKKIPITGHPNDLGITHDGKLLLVCIAETPGALDIIDTASLEKVKSIPVKARLHDVVTTRDGKYAVATSPAGKSVIVFDLQKQEVAWDIQFDKGVLVPAVDGTPGGAAHRIFVQVGDLNGFAVVDFDKHQELTRIKFPDDGPVKTVGGATSHGMAVAPDGKTIWALSRTYNCVFVYSLPGLVLQGRVSLPEIKPPNHDPISGAPNWVAFTPDGKMAYIANGADRSVSAIDTKTLKSVARIPAGEEPGRMSALTLP